VNPEKPFRRLSPGARADLLRVLTSPSNVRADVIRQFHERGKDEMVEVLVQLEADPQLRAEVVIRLREVEAWS
jgi:ACT domain-containing protein